VAATRGTWNRDIGCLGAARVVERAREVFGALPGDLNRSLRRRPAKPMRIELGVRPATDAMQIALYVHYSASGHLSEMVRCQLALLGQFGLAIVFISMAGEIPEDDWQAVRQLCALVVQRPNFGRDFGAWPDLMPEVTRCWPVSDGPMLVNDSVLEPIHAHTVRSGGEELYGLTESLQGGPHLQGYMLIWRAEGPPSPTSCGS
jgi:hypothetical protein